MYDVVVPWWDGVATGQLPADAPRSPRVRRLRPAATPHDQGRVLQHHGAGRRPGRPPRRPRRPAHQAQQQDGADIILACGPATLGPLASTPGLVDEYLIAVHPTVITAGRRMFDHLTRDLALELVHGEVFDAGSAVLHHRVVSRRSWSPQGFADAGGPRQREDQVSNYVQLGDVHLLRGGRHRRAAGAPTPGTGGLAGLRGVRARARQALPPLRPDRRGHGRTPDVEGPITYALMAQDTIAFLDQVVGGPASLLGHSDGAPVALLAALERPDLVRKLVLSAGVFHHDGWAPGAIDLDDETIAFFTDYWGAVAPGRTRPLPGREGQAGPDAPRGAHPHRRRPRRLPRAGARHGRRQRRGDPHRAHPRPPPGTAQRATGGAARHRPRRPRCQIVINFLTKRAEEA